MTSTSPAGVLVDTVDTWAEAAQLVKPPLLVRQEIEGLLDHLGLGQGSVSERRIGGGHSNVTFLIEREGWCGVLRRPPRPPYQAKAHDMMREVRVQRALHGTTVAVPTIVYADASSDLLGAPFYLMDHLEGEVYSTELPPEKSAPSTRRCLGRLVADTLADLHAVDPEAAGLASWGKAGDLAERQLATFGRLWQTHRTREIAAVEAAERWLVQHRPPPSGSPTIVHGDYRLANLMWRPGGSPRLAGLLDWELATVGEPLFDLGYLLSTYPQHESETGVLLDEAAVLASEGFPTRGELVQRYVEQTDRDVTTLTWWVALAFWRTAVGLESFYRRGLAGTTDDPFILGLGEGVPRLAEQALVAIEDAWI